MILDIVSIDFLKVFPPLLGQLEIKVQLNFGAAATRNDRVVLLVAQPLLRELKLKFEFLGQQLKTFYAVMLVLNKLYILNLQIALIANTKPVGTLSLLDVLVQLFFSKNSALGAFVGALEEILGALALQVIEIVIVAKLALRPALLALECNPVKNLFYYQGMELGPLILDLAVWAISVAYLLGPYPFIDTVFAKPFFALQTLLRVEHHVVADDTGELILVVLLINQTRYVYNLVRDVFYRIHI